MLFSDDVPCSGRFFEFDVFTAPPDMTLLVYLQQTQVNFSHLWLEQLELRGCSSGRLTLDCPGLHSLYLRSCQLVMLSATGCPGLRTLELSNCNKLTDMTLRSILTGLTQLHTLRIMKGVPVTDDTVREVRRERGGGGKNGSCGR